jgi:cohesin complex subunit SA-1/2
MDTSNNNETSSPALTSGPTRRSGRATKPVNKFTPDAPAATKRKRGERDDEDVENESPDGQDQDSDADGGDDAAEEEVERPKRKKPSSVTNKAKKPTAKRPKINGDAPAPVPTNHAAKLPSRPKKNVRIAIARPGADGLYGNTPICNEQRDALI